MTLIPHLYCGKEVKRNCKNYKGIKLLSVVGKVYKIIIDKFKMITDELVEDEHREHILYNFLFKLKKLTLFDFYLRRALCVPSVAQIAVNVFRKKLYDIILLF